MRERASPAPARDTVFGAIEVTMRVGHILAIPGILPLLLLGTGCSGVAAGTDPATSVFLADALSGLESLRKDQADEERPYWEAAIDALKRLRDHRSWSVVNTPIEEDLLHGIWIREGRTDGYREELHFGHDTSGSWDREKGYVPTEFVWLIEGRHLRLLSQGYYKESCNHQYLDRTYEYEFRGDHLLLRRNGELLQFVKSKK